MEITTGTELLQTAERALSSLSKKGRIKRKRKEERRACDWEGNKRGVLFRGKERIHRSSPILAISEGSLSEMWDPFENKWGMEGYGKEAFSCVPWGGRSSPGHLRRKKRRGEK